MQLFLQSKEWEEFQKSIGRKTWRIDGALVVKHDLPFGFNYLYCPRPDFSNKQQVISNKFLDEVEKVAKTEKSIFLKIDPASAGQLSIVNCKLSDSIQPRKTIVIDLQKPESEILSKMREKTRYNIRLAERRGVNEKNLKTEEFWRLLQETAKRDSFQTHEKQHYEKLLAIRSQNFSNELFCVEYRGEVLAAAIVNFYGNTATYLHGASSRKDKEVMAPYLLHWRIIQKAKKLGFAKYDFGGINEIKWPGVTRFKLGFGGEIFEYPSSTDIIYRPVLYKIYRLARNLRR